ncbi:MAG TPA: hypothetical protein VK911_14520 [Vicinamibacterales bacterium]|nr:hypothetical protein [Vicinamibacterales bacterium]
MRLTWFALVSRRRPMLAGVVLALALVFGSASLTFAQEAQAETPQKPTVAFQNDAGLIILYVKSDRTADFEQLMTRFREGLGKMEEPEMRQQASSLKLFRGPEGNGTAVYVMIADPVVKNVEYWFLSLLYKAFPADAQALYQQWTDVKAPNQPSVFDLTLVNRQ